jgi:fibronectin type 3 domain-containing protein
LQYRVCSECGECETSAIAKTEHRITLKTTAPTYTENGYTEHICSDCGYSYKDSFTPKKTLAIPEITGYSSAETGIRLNWKKVDGASGYRIYMYDAEKNKWGSAATVGESVTTYRKSGLAGGTLYKFKVKAFVKAGGKTIFGEACKIYTAASKPAKSKLLKPSVSNSAIRVKWKAQKCTGYQIYIYRNGQWKRAKTVFDSGITEFRISRLDKNTSYKIKVRAFTVDSDGKRVYGSFSDLTNVKTKK